MKDLMKKDTKGYMKTHPTYSLSEEFLRTYFPKSVYGLSPNPAMKFKKGKR